jgi:hypothetical protein
MHHVIPFGNQSGLTCVLPLLPKQVRRDLWTLH